MRKELRELAVKYKESKLWNQVSENKLIKIELTSGQGVYVYFIGGEGEFIALNIYNDEQVRSYQKMILAVANNEDFLEAHEGVASQDCIQISFDADNDMEPVIERYIPFHFPWDRVSDEEETTAIEVLRYILNTKVEDMTTAQLPALSDESPKPVIFNNDIMCAKVKSLPKAGEWEACINRFIEPISVGDDQPLYYPMMLFAVEKERGIMIPGGLASDYENNPQEVLLGFANGCQSVNMCPERIVCANERTYCLLKDFGDRVGIVVDIAEEGDDMQALAIAKYNFLQRMTGELNISDVESDYDDYDDMLDDEEDLTPEQESEIILQALMMFDSEELEQMDDEFKEKAIALLDEHVFPIQLEEQIRNKIKNW